MSEFLKTYNKYLDANDFEQLHNKISNSQLIDEPHFIQIIPKLLEKLTDFKTSEQATKIGDLIISKMNPFSMKLYMDKNYNNN